MGRRTTFTLEEAKRLLPRIREITRTAVEECQPWIEGLRSPGTAEGNGQRVRQLLQRRLDRWAEDLATFGVSAKGLWLVDFDSGGGYYCWRYDEPDILFFHGYEEGFVGRAPIQ